LVLLAGKGHETYQIIGTQKHHFDDREEARNILKEMLTTKTPSSPRMAKDKNETRK
jgi:hypothetical protein